MDVYVRALSYDAAQANVFVSFTITCNKHWRREQVSFDSEFYCVALASSPSLHFALSRSVRHKYDHIDVRVLVFATSVFNYYPTRIRTERWTVNTEQYSITAFGRIIFRSFCHKINTILSHSPSHSFSHSLTHSVAYLCCALLGARTLSPAERHNYATTMMTTNQTYT